MSPALPPQHAETLQASRTMVRLLHIVYHEGGPAATQAVGDVPTAELAALAKVLTGALYAATVDLSDFHGVPILQFLRAMAFNVETTPGAN